MVVPFSRKPVAGQRPFSVKDGCDATGLDALVHLAGEPILGIWTAAKRRRIRDSRVLGTRSIVESLSRADPPPKVFVSASAIGYYGNTGDSEADEESSPGAGFLAEVSSQWEAEAVRAESLGIRVVRLRIGFVIGPGGAMRLILPIFRAGVGGNLGNGRQWMSPVHVDDVAGLALWAVGNSGVEGPLNAVIPEPVRNADFTQSLAAILGRPAFLPAPSIALRLLLRELASVMLDSCRVVPRRAIHGGYVFRKPTLADALSGLARPASH